MGKIPTKLTLRQKENENVRNSYKLKVGEQEDREVGDRKNWEGGNERTEGRGRNLFLWRLKQSRE